MLDCLASGKLIRDPSLKTSQAGKPYCNFLIAVPVNDGDPVVMTGICFGDIAEKVGRLKKGDALCVAGSLSPSSWVDKNTGEEKSGWSITANQTLSAYDIKKRRPKAETPEHSGAYSPPGQYSSEPEFDDPIGF